MDKPFLEVFQVKPGTYEGDFFNRPSKAIPWDYVYFEALYGKYHGKRILVIHGSEDGMFTINGHNMLAKYTDVTDMIFCCHPNMVRQLQQDPRIFGYSSSQVWISGIKRGEAITITMSSRRV